MFGLVFSTFLRPGGYNIPGCIRWRAGNTVEACLHTQTALILRSTALITAEPPSTLQYGSKVARKALQV